MKLSTKEKRRQATQEEKSKYEGKRGTVHQTLKFILIFSNRIRLKVHRIYRSTQDLQQSTKDKVIREELVAGIA